MLFFRNPKLSPKRPLHHIALRWTLLLLVVIPVSAWFLVKPVRLLIPTWAGLSCPTASICLDDPSQLPRAQALHAEAVGFVGRNLVPLAGTPRVIFCAAQACADSFGLGARSAVTLGTWGTVIGPRAWRDYYVRHELIHQLQAQRLGVLSLLLKPSWLVEGMAYSESLDPRVPLAQPFEGYREAFRAWYATRRGALLWTEAAGL